ncbi:MAG: hypothetical protein EOP07_06535 [Proteobacteria bacterium]|nr:MAG: hypothetical protein EOP07_06535 [Pseudomonadota bacterium]
MIRKLFAIAALSFAFASTSYAGIFPSVVPSLDLNNFLGRWYEVASTHPSQARIPPFKRIVSA